MPRISDLPAAPAATDEDLIPASQAGTTRRMSRAQLVAGLKPDRVAAPGRLLGRGSAGAGPIEELTLGTGLSLEEGRLEIDPVAGGFAPSPGTAATTAFTPSGTIAATTVQAAIAELDAEKASATHGHPASAITSGTFTADRLGAGIADSGVFLRGDLTWTSVPAPSATAVGFAPSGTIAATTVQSAIAELDAEKASATHTHAASAITSGTFAADRLGAGTANSGVFLRGDLTWASVAPPTASAVTFAPSGTIAASTVQAAIAELDAEKAALAHSHAASAITSGIFTADRLGAGTANSGVFLRGDLTWASVVPPAASAVTFAPAGAIAATTVQTAIAELDAEKAPATHTHAIAAVTGLQAALDAKRNDSVSGPNRLLGRSSIGAGTVEELTVGAGLTLTGGVLAADAATGVLPLSDIIGSAYTAGSADWFRRRRYTGTTDINVTINGDPGAGVVAAWIQWGTGKVTLVGTGGHTLRPAFGTTLTETTGAFSMILLERISATESIVYGGPIAPAAIDDVANLSRELDRRMALGPTLGVAGRWLGAPGAFADVTADVTNALRLHLMPLWVPGGMVRGIAFRVQTAFAGGTLAARATIGLYAMNDDGSPGALVSHLGAFTTGLNTIGTRSLTGLSVPHPVGAARFLGLLLDRQDTTSGALLAAASAPDWFQARVGRLNADGAFGVGTASASHGWLGGTATWSGSSPTSVAATASLVATPFACAIQVNPS